MASGTVFSDNVFVTGSTVQPAVLPAAPSAPAIPTSYTVVIQRFKASFTTEFAIPVVEDPNLPVTIPNVKVLADIQTPFKFSIEDAIQAAERHLSIRDKMGHTHENPDWLVEDWINLLRWEVSAFWEVEPAGHWYGETSDPEIHVTSEHPRRAGEMLAEGITVLFAERRLKISRAKIFFYERKKGKKGNARPDFAIDHKGQPHLGIALNGRNLFGLESRSRKLMGNIPKSDHAKLKKKRGTRFAGVLAVYCSYGKPTKKTVRTRIQLADPEDVAAPADDQMMDEMLLTHYIKVLSRLGMWNRRALFERRLLLVRKDPRAVDKTIAPKPQIDDRRTIPRTFRGQNYRGRMYSSLLVAVARAQLTRAEALARFEKGDYGYFVFRGLNVRVLEHIDAENLRLLENYFDELAQQGYEDATVGGDGTLTWRLNPDAMDLKGVRMELAKAAPESDPIPIDLEADSEDYGS